MKRISFLAVLIASLVVIFFGWRLISRWPLNYADSDDLALASYTGGLAHPPGYSPLTIWLHPWLTRVEPIQVAVIVNGASMMAQLMSGLILTGLFIRIFMRISKKDKEVHFAETVALVWLSILLWSSSEMILWHGRVMEVFSFSTLLLSSWVWVGWESMLLSAKSPVKRKMTWLGLGFLGGINIFFHQITTPLILAGTSVVVLVHFNKLINIKIKESYLINKTGRSILLLEPFWWTVLGMTLTMMGLMTSYALFFDRNLLYSWQIEPSISGVFQFFSRWVLIGGGSEVESMALNFDLLHSIKSIGIWLGLNWEHFGWLWVIIGLGWVWMWKNYRQIFWWYLPVLVIYGPLLAAFIKFPLSNLVSSETELIWGTMIRERMFYVFEWGLVLPIVTGVWWLYSGFKKIYRPWFILGLGSAAIILWGVSFKKIDILEDRIMSDFVANQMAQLPSEGVVLVDSDLVFAMLYQQIILKHRTDLVIVPVTTLMRGEWFDQQNGILYEQRFVERNQQAAEVVRYSLLQGKRIFLFDPGLELINAIGVEGDPFFAFPRNYLIEISLRPFSEATYDYVDSDEVEMLAGLKSKWLRGLRAHVGQQLVTQAYYWNRMGYVEIAAAQAEVAKSLLDNQSSWQAVESTLKLGHDLYLEHGSYTGYQVLTGDGYVAKALEAMVNQQTDKVWYFVTRALLVEPKNEKALNLLSELQRQWQE